MTEQKEVVGKVEAVSIKDNNRYSIRIGDSWYSGFGKPPAKGTEIAVTYVETPEGWKNIKKWIAAPELKPADEVKSEETIIWYIRLECLKLAASMKPETQEKLLELANLLEGFIFR